MADSESRLANLKAIMQWSLRQAPSGELPAMPTDPERQQWLREALESVASAPSETDLLKAALAVLRAHAPSKESSGAASQTDEVKTAVMTAFEDVQYFIEDLDHANDLIPLNGVQVIASYVNYGDAPCKVAACDIIGTACQNNPPAQKAFRPTLRRLIDLVCMDYEEEGTRVKALYAVSCLVRDCEENLADFAQYPGVIVLLGIMLSPAKRLQLKALFLLRSILSAEKTTEGLVAEDFAPHLVGMVKSEEWDGELKEMAALALCAAMRKSQYVLEQCQGDLQLKEMLQARVQEPSTAESEREAYQSLFQAMSPS